MTEYYHARALSQDFAEYVLVRNGVSGPAVFMIHVTFGEDGIWRIESM